MTIGQKIENMRRTANLSQRELANILKVSASSICLWENDETIPRMHKLQLMANLFGVPISYFVQDVVVSRKDEMIALFGALNEEGQDRVMEYAQMLLNSGYIKNNTVSVGNQAI